MPGARSYRLSFGGDAHAQRPVVPFYLLSVGVAQIPGHAARPSARRRCPMPGHAVCPSGSWSFPMAGHNVCTSRRPSGVGGVRHPFIPFVLRGVDDARCRVMLFKLSFDMPMPGNAVCLFGTSAMLNFGSSSLSFEASAMHDSMSCHWYAGASATPRYSGMPFVFGASAFSICRLLPFVLYNQ